MPAVLECEGLRKAFGGIPVLNGVSLALGHGTVTALAGENGAGSSYSASGGSIVIVARARPSSPITRPTER